MRRAYGGSTGGEARRTPDHDQRLKKQAIAGMVTVFSGKAEAAEAVREGEIDQLRAKIGQRVVERDSLRRAFQAVSVGRDAT